MAWQQLLHIHIYKNAGSTFDRLLLHSLGDRFVKFDPGPPGSKVTQEDFEAVRRANPAALAFSSHKVSPDIAKCMAENVLPFAFLRNPLDRVRSTYDFEHRENPSRTESQRYAAAHTFVEWLAWQLDRPGGGGIGNFQTHQLNNIGEKDKSLPLRQARKVIRTLPVLGIVERFNESVDLLQHTLGSSFKFNPQYERRNTTQSQDKSLSDRLDALGEQLDHRLYRKLLSAMEMDLALYAEAVTLFHDKWSAAKLVPGGAVAAKELPPRVNRAQQPVAK